MEVNMTVCGQSFDKGRDICKCCEYYWDCVPIEKCDDDEFPFG